MKYIVVKNKEGKKVYELNISDAELAIAEKLGLTSQQYITERVKLGMDEKGAKHK
jgi:hypothetical protein